MTDLLTRLRAMDETRRLMREAVCQDEVDAARRCHREAEDALREDLHALLRQGEEAA